jgi:hypothetical protein
MRWLRYFREAFSQTPTWYRLVGRLALPGRAGAVLADLLTHFVRARGDPTQGLIACLVALQGAGR